MKKMSLVILFIVLCATAHLPAYAMPKREVPAHSQRQEIAKKFQQTLKLAQAGDAQAQYDVSSFYITGSAVSRNVQEGTRWITKAAEQGQSDAQLTLANWYSTGQGEIKEDKIAAYIWAYLSAEQGIEDAKVLRAELETKLTPEQITEARRRTEPFIGKKWPQDPAPVPVAH